MSRASRSRPRCAGAWLGVGGERRAWREGELLAFDDTVEHEAHNPADSERWVLMIDALRPGLTGPPYDPRRLPEEVRALAAQLGVAI